MNWILNIDTAVQSASVCLAADGKSVGIAINPSPKDQAAWLHIAIQQLLQENNLSLPQLSAIAISAGPGSYTGLRVGMAAAKGLCFALHIPLITINTLKMMAVAAMAEPTDLVCPMIDARRMEVFTAIYDKQLNEIALPHNIILTEDSFTEFLNKHTITFFGNGSNKFQTICHQPNAIFKTIKTTAVHLTTLSYACFQQKQFADLAYCEPYYGKTFYSPTPKKII